MTFKIYCPSYAGKMHSSEGNFIPNVLYDLQRLSVVLDGISLLRYDKIITKP